MSMIIFNGNEIWLSTDNRARRMEDTGFSVVQRGDKTVVYSGRDRIGGNYAEHDMPHPRYSLSHSNPKPLHATPELAAKFPPPPGRDQFEADLRALIAEYAAQ